jgi:hypothetical protein
MAFGLTDAERPTETPTFALYDPVANPPTEFKVFISHRESICDECREELGRGAWILLAGEGKALCLACADLDHLVFLPTGDAALTRRSKKNSRLSAVVLKWSGSRGRYERQGLLVEEAALTAAEAECHSDAESRRRQRERAAARRAELDEEFVREFADQIRMLYPACPEGRVDSIAEHACQKYTGRIGRSAAGRRLDSEAVQLAVVAHVRHTETDYDTLLARGWNRRDAREHARDPIAQVLASWAATAYPPLA